MANRWIALGAASGLVAVVAGAFGAHGLKDRLSPEMLAAWETAVRYQMWHALALLAVAGLEGRVGGLPAAAWCFAAGTVLFSGSLYVYAVTGMKWLGMTAPFGGLTLMAGWACLAVGAAQTSSRPPQIGRAHV